MRGIILSYLLISSILVPSASSGQALSEVEGLATASTAEFQVNARTSSDQANADIAMDLNGNFVVVWSSRFGTPGRSNDISGRRFDPNCSPVGDEFQINTIISGNQKEPSVAMDTTGNFTVAWQGPGLLEDDEEDIFIQRFDPNGQPLGDELLVNTYTQGKQQCPKVAMSRDGAFAVVWESEKLEADTTVVSCQLFDANGLAVGEEFEVDLLGDCRYPDIAMDPNGNFAVVWMEDKSNNLIMIRLYNSDGTARTKPLDASTIKFNTITRPAIAMDANGYFVVVWDGDPETEKQDDIHARLFDPNGAAMGDQFIVNNTTLDGKQQNPQVAMNNMGEFVIVWESEIESSTVERDIFGQRYDSLGQPIGGEFQLNTFVEGDQRYPAVASSDNGVFVTVWQSDEQDGSGWGIFGQMKSIADFAELDSLSVFTND